jgi:DNA repair photolyase
MKMLNQVSKKGNMYQWVDATYNVVSGACAHDCKYCYVKQWGELKPIHINEKLLTLDLGTGKTIFVGSGIDLFAENVKAEWIEKIMKHCKEYDNIYLFQSKNPQRFYEFQFSMPEKVILGTTLETNRDTSSISKAPPTTERARIMHDLRVGGYRVMLSVEPVLEFDLDEFAKMLIDINPEFISIGADSKGHSLPEPSVEKVKALIEQLEAKGIKVLQKSNLKRLMVK